MPIISASQLIGKTLTIKQAAPFYRVNDINNLGDRAKPVSNMLPAGYQFIVDGFLTKTQLIIGVAVVWAAGYLYQSIKK